MEEMKIKVNGVEMEFNNEGVDEVGIQMSNFTAPDGSSQILAFLYSEPWEGSGVWHLLDDGYDCGNQSHDEFIEFLMEKTDCSEDEAIEVIEEVCGTLDSTVCIGDSEELQKLYEEDTTVVVLDVNFTNQNIDASILETEDEDHKYLGVIKENGDILTIVSFTQEEYDVIEEEADQYYVNDLNRWIVIFDAIKEKTEQED